MINFLLKVAGKESLNLDSNIPLTYIIRLCLKYGIMMTRGYIYSFFYYKKSKKLFLSSRVKIINTKKLMIGNNIKFNSGVYIDALSTDGVIISDNVTLGRNTRIECTGSLNFIGKGIKIGKNSSFGSDCFFGAAGGIEVGNDVIGGQNIRFHSENHNFKSNDILIRNQGVTHKGIKVGNNCWIGAGAVFLDGAEIGDGTVVAANTVVTKKFPSNVVIAGVPAKKINNRIEMKNV